MGKTFKAILLIAAIILIAGKYSSIKNAAWPEAKTVPAPETYAGRPTHAWDLTPIAPSTVRTTLVEYVPEGRSEEHTTHAIRFESSDQSVGIDPIKALPEEGLIITSVQICPEPGVHQAKLHLKSGEVWILQIDKLTGFSRAIGAKKI